MLSAGKQRLEAGGGMREGEGGVMARIDLVPSSTEICTAR